MRRLFTTLTTAGWFVPLATLAALLTGLIVRMRGLGTWPFEVDEYYLAKATLSILGNGLPNFDCGGFYTRGLLQQYISAGAVWLLDNGELAMRLYPMAANLATLWVVFLLGRRLGGTIAGCLTLALMSLSLWEIEMARFARMYAPFQLLAVTQVYLFVRCVFDGRHALFKWMLAICLLGVVTYEVAIFLLLPVVVALFRVPEIRRPAPLLATGGAAAVALGWVLVPFRTLGVQQTPLPPDLVSALAGPGKGLVDLPELGHLAQLPAHPSWLVGLAVLLCALIAVSLRRSGPLRAMAVLGWIVTLACFALSLVPLGLVICLAVTFLLQSETDRRASQRFVVRTVVPAALISLLFWAVYLTVGLDVPARRAAVTLLKYPNLFDPVIYVFARAVPVLSVVILAPIVVYAAVALGRGGRRSDAFLCVAAMAVTFLVGVALIDSTYHETRYSFFVYPLFLVLFGCSMTALAEAVPAPERVTGPVAFVVALALFSLTEDADLRHYRRIDSPEINFRTVYRPSLQEHYKFRDDNRSPAEYVNARLRPGDTVIIAESGVDMYAAQVDFRFKDATGVDFVNHISCGVERDVWSDAPVIYSDAKLREVIDTAQGTVWIIKRNFVAPFWLSQHQVFVAADGRMQVLRVPPSDASSSGGPS